MIGLYVLTMIAGCVTCVVLAKRRYNTLKEKDDYENTKQYDYIILCMMFFCVFILAATVSGTTLVIKTMELASEDVLEQKIARYQEENARIEYNINLVLRLRIQHELNTFNKFKPDDTPTLARMLSKLESDPSLQGQVKLYIFNEQRIESLKNEKAEVRRKKWLLYFGG